MNPTTGGGLFFIGSLLALGVTGTFSAILSALGLWGLRRGPPVTGSPAKEGQVRADANVEGVS